LGKLRQNFITFTGFKSIIEYLNYKQHNQLLINVSTDQWWGGIAEKADAA
jgi:hypothetical protein